MMVHAIMLSLLIGFLSESITTIIRKADPIRPAVDFVSSKSNFLRDLLSCGYCLSFWVCLFLTTTVATITSNDVLFFEFNFLNKVLNYSVMLIISHRFSNIIHGAIDKYFDRTYDKRYRSFFDEE